MAEIELHPGIPHCDVQTLNRLARQQGLCLAIAQASVYDEICLVIALSPPEVALSPTECEALIEIYWQEQGIVVPEDREAYLRKKGWDHEDLSYVAARKERIKRYQTQVFSSQVEEHFLSQKSTQDQFTFSLIRVQDGDLAFELHQRIINHESSFEDIARSFSEGPERETGGQCGPFLPNQAHSAVVEKLRNSTEGELLEPLLLENVWLILRLNHWDGNRLDETMRLFLLEELFEQWLNERVKELLEGKTPGQLHTLYGKSSTAEIELHPGIAYCDVATLNRIIRQQDLCVAIAQASVYDEICQVIPLSPTECKAITESYLQQKGLLDSESCEAFLREKGWSHDDLNYFASRKERIKKFQQQVFSAEIERYFLSQKLSHDEVTYSFIRVRDGDLAFELYQRLIDDESDFENIARTFSNGPERETGGRYGPVPFNQAHPTVVEKLRTSTEGELLEPFFLENVWILLRLDHWKEARLDEAMRLKLLDSLFEEWLDKRVTELVEGRTPGPLPTHLLQGVEFPV